MTTAIVAPDLTKKAPRSPRDRIAGFVIARRAADKCRASLAGTLGEYKYDCSLDKLLFEFKDISGEQFKAVVQGSSTDEEVGDWLHANGARKTPAEVKAWSDEVEAASPMRNPQRRSDFIERCHGIGLNPHLSTTFDWLEADDRETFRRKSG